MATTTQRTKPAPAAGDGFEYRDPTSIKIFREHPQIHNYLRNPRLLSSNGFKTEKMKRLSDSVIETGITSPPVIGRLPDGEEWLAGGERRMRTVLGLLAKDTFCYNPATRKKEKASVVYGGGVKCRIVECRDIKALVSLALQDNILHEQLSDYELMKMAVDMEEAGLSRAEQAEIFRLSEGWLSQTHKLAKMPKRVHEWLENDVFGRSAGLICLQVDPSQLDNVLTVAMQTSAERAKAEEAVATKAHDAATDEVEAADTALRLSAFAGSDDVQRRARKRFDAAGREAARTQQKLKQASDRVQNPHITGDDIQAAAAQVGADGDITRTRPMKTVRQDVQSLAEMSWAFAKKAGAS